MKGEGALKNYKHITDHCPWVGLRGVWYKRYREYTVVNLRYGMDPHPKENIRWNTGMVAVQKEHIIHC